MLEAKSNNSNSLQLLSKKCPSDFALFTHLKRSSISEYKIETFKEIISSKAKLCKKKTAGVESIYTKFLKPQLIYNNESIWDSEQSVASKMKSNAFKPEIKLTIYI